MDLAATCRKNLEALADPAGGWGYAPGRTPQVEPTCLALLALSLDQARHATVLERGLACLRRWQGDDGAFRVQHGRPEAVWPTAIALLCQTVLGEPEAFRSRAASWLLETRGRRLENTVELREVSDIDVSLVGWPWAEDTFSWVEPTALAMLALQRAGWSGHPRIAEGVRLLLDRAFDEGGINYGNRIVLGKKTEPVVISTALMLLALAGRNAAPRVAAARTYLLRALMTEHDLENLCWARLALDLSNADPEVAVALPVLDRRIVAAHAARQEVALFSPAPIREALTSLALSTERVNLFRLPAASPAATPPPLVPIARHRPTLGDRWGRFARGLGVKALGHLRPAPPQAQVHIAPAANYDMDLARVLTEQYAAFRARVPLAGKRVVLKPNLVEYHRDKPINTHPHVIAAAIELCRREGAAEVIVAEGPAHWRNTEFLVTASGLADVLRHYGAAFVDVNHDDPVKTPNLGRLTKLEYLYLAKTIATADVVISLAKLKTHHWAGVTLALKNFFGILPGVCYGWPKNELHWRGIENSIVDITLTRTPDLAIVDGIVGMEGDGPINGSAKPVGVLVMGVDPVAVDATCCRLMQLEPEKIGHLALAQFKKLGVLDAAKIEQLGEGIARFRQPFATVPAFAPVQLQA